MYISEIRTKAPADERMPLERKFYDTLEKLKIPYEQVDNDPASSMEECAEVDKAIGTEIRKNVFLCNQKKTTFFLLVDKAFDTSSFSKKLGVSHMSFAPPEKMLEHLGTTPGSASVAGLLTDEDDYVQVIIDKEVAEAEWFGCNPGINTSHLKFRSASEVSSGDPSQSKNCGSVESREANKRSRSAGKREANKKSRSARKRIVNKKDRSVKDRIENKKEQ